MNNNYPYRNRDKYEIPQSDREVTNPYDQDSKLFQDLEQRDYDCVYVQSINLGVAGSLYLPKSGYHFCVFGRDASTNKAVDTTVLLNIWINKKTNNGSVPYPAKHGRGYSGPFSRLYIEWPAQTNGASSRFLDLVIYKCINQPWIDGEAPT